MPKFSANLGFLWTELPIPERIEAAGAAGFSAVEFHHPFEHSTAEISDSLAAAGTTPISLNTGLGANGAADLGVTARPGREAEALELLDQAIEYAAAIGCPNINVTPGTTGRADGCEATFQANLTEGCRRAADHGITLMIEPLSPGAAPNAHVSLVGQALATIDAVGADNLKVLFDCFHIESTEGQAMSLLERHLGQVAHVQIAAVPDRGEPDHGTLDHTELFMRLDSAGYQGWIGAEYKPAGTVEAGLGWFHALSPSSDTSNAGGNA